MAKKESFWERSKLELIPVLICMGILAGLGGIYAWNQATYERKVKEANAAKSVVDTANQVKDTIALSAVPQKQR